MLHVPFRSLCMWFGKLRWFQRNRLEREASRQLIMEEFQNLKKLFRKQSLLIEEMRREQQAAAAGENRDLEPLIELCDAVFYLQQAFRPPGLMSRQHAQVLNLVIKKMEQFGTFFDLEMIQEEGVPFNPEIHQALENRSPGNPSPEILEVVQPGYLRKGRVLRPARVIVGTTGASIFTERESTPS